MSWLVTLLLASSVFMNSSGANYSPNRSYEYTSETKTIVLDETERFEQTYPLNSNGKVSVSNINGSITVEAWDRNEVRLEVTKIADSKETLQDVEIKIDSKPDYFEVETDYGSWNRGNKNWKNSRKLEVEFRLSVPRTAVLDEIETVNGSVTVSNFTNYTEISAVNGSVKATNLRGTAKLSTVNGTTNAEFERLQPGDKINLSTVNGSVNLTIPSDANATVKADTVNGAIKNDFGLPVRKGKYVGRDLYGKIGGGETEIKLNSVNGGLSIIRKNDGRNQNPAVNLLPQKSQNDDDDWDDDDDDDSMIQTERMNRDIERTMKRAQVDMEKANAEAAKAMDEAQKEIEKIQPELDKIQPVINETVEQAIKDSAKAVTEVMNEEMQAKLREKLELNRAKLARLRNVNFNLGSPNIENKSQTFDVKGKPKIKIEAGNCDITVRGWDESKVRYEFTNISKNRTAKPAEIVTDNSNSSVTIKINSPDEDGFPNGNRLMRLEIFVPKKSDLKILTEGEIRLENVTGEIDLSSGESSINVRDSDGKMVLNSDEGKIRVVGFRGELQAIADEGDIYLEGIFDKISANAGEGNIFLSLPEDANATLSTNGNVRFEDLQSQKESETKWRIGSGANNYSFTMPEGVLTVRKSASAVYGK